jgi:hypothetical protein
MRRVVILNLEGRVGVEELGVGAAAFADGGEQAFEDFAAPVAIGEAGPEVDFPGFAPAGAAVVAGVAGVE